MGMFHCPLGVPYYDCEGCIDCGMCLATSKQEMIAASKRIRKYLQAHRGNTGQVRKIAICGKGGVGKSTVVALLAKTLQGQGFSVLVIDNDESNPGLFRLLGLEKEPAPLNDLLNLIAAGQDMSEIKWLQQDRLAVKDIPSEYVISSNGLHFLMAGKIQDPFQGCACSMAHIIRELVEKLATNDRELVLVDMEAGVESFGRGVERSVDTVLVVVEPSFQSLALAGRINYMAEGMGISRVRAILNKVTSPETIEKMTDQLDRDNITIGGIIDFDPKVSEAGFEGRALGESTATDDSKTIIENLLGE